MASWAEFEAAEPRFASRVRKLMGARKHMTMATLRRDGAPRISGTEVQFVGKQLQIGSMPGAVKAIDLRRDSRIAIHGPTSDPAKSGKWRGEAKVAGQAIEVRTTRKAHTFRIDIQEVVVTGLNAKGDALTIESWSPAQGYRSRERS
ncbi:MAG TPA: pyridoxamine 5'-phosphate oxidase family protein [Candidatus Dormibacteraeota bacterium]